MRVASGLGGGGGSGGGKEGWDSGPVLKVESIGLAQDLDRGGGSADEKRQMETDWRFWAEPPGG